MKILNEIARSAICNAKSKTSSVKRNDHINVRVLSLASLMLATILFTSGAQADTNACDTRVNNTQNKLSECITKENLVKHLEAFQLQANANTDLPGTRYTGTAGYNASRDYIVAKMQAAGYVVTLQDVPITLSYTAIREMDMVAPTPTNYVFLTDFNPMTNTDGGNVTAEVAIPPGDPRGCLATDFTGFPAGKIALVKRVGTSGSPGECPMRTKALNAAAAGAIGVIAYRQDQAANILTAY
nr:hypothetical protein [Pseudomonadota bacterium]